MASLGTGVGMTEKVGPGGLISLGTYLDPALTKGDLMVGSLVGRPGTLPAPKTHVSVDLQLFEQAVGSAEPPQGREGEDGRVAEAQHRHGRDPGRP